ncbi:MAG: hypothetical protein QOI62_1741 [Solirubrobacteraceae bacterium]|nr:hypothetical protein [Solirubrobacteraceae bacterium]
MVGGAGGAAELLDVVARLGALGRRRTAARAVGNDLVLPARPDQGTSHGDLGQYGGYREHATSLGARSHSRKSSFRQSYSF